MSTAPYEGRVPVFTKGDRYRKARELTGLTVRDFAQKIGVSHGTVTNAEKDHRKVRPIVTNAWADVSGVPAKWLETGITPVSGDDGEGGEVPSGVRVLDSGDTPTTQEYVLLSAAA